MGMIVFGISMLTNTGLNYILIFGKFGAPALGITGAAIATLTSRVLEFVIVAVYAPRYRRVPLMLRLLLRPGGAMARSFLKYATPVLVNEVLWGLGVSVMTAVMGHMAISTDMLAAHAIMGNIDKFSTVACFGIAGATAVIVGKRIGEGAGREEVYSLGCCLLTVSFGVGLVVSVCLAVLLPTVFIPYLYPLFHLEGLALEIAITMCVVYLFMLPLKAFDITNITGLLRAGGDSRMASIIDLSCQWVIAVPLTFLTALVFNAPVAVVCLCIQSENVCKCPWGILRLRSRKWIHDVTGEDPCWKVFSAAPSAGRRWTAETGPIAARPDTVMTSPGRATPICCPPIKSTPPRRGMTGIWPPHGGISSPRGIMTCFSIRSVVRFCLFPANRR